jgi:replicative DNA helicase
MSLRKTVDITMLVAELWADYQESILSISVKVWWTHWLWDYVQKLKEAWQLREIKKLWSMIDMWTLDKVDDIMSVSYKRIWELMYQSSTDLSIEESLNNLLEKAGTVENRIWLFGYKEIDSKTFWLKPWKLTIIMARPWVGKTLTAVNIMSNLMDQWIKSLMLSGEMSKEEVLQRFLSIRYWIAPHNFESKKGIQIMDMIAQSWVDDYAYIPEYLDISDASLIDYTIYHKIYTAYHRDNIKVIIIDYIQLATTSEKPQNRAYEIGKISNRMKRLCNELWIHIIALAQVSREWAKSGSIGLEHLKDCWELEQDADNVFSLNKEEDGNSKITWIEIDILKNRSWWWLWSYTYRVIGAKITGKLANQTK